MCESSSNELEFMGISPVVRGKQGFIDTRLFILLVCGPVVSSSNNCTRVDGADAQVVARAQEDPKSTTVEIEDLLR